VATSQTGKLFKNVSYRRLYLQALGEALGWLSMV